MNDSDAQAAFHRAMRENPDDDHVRLVYADWLQDRGHHVPAERLRWWVAAKNHPAGYLDANEHPAIYGAAPPWVDQMVSTTRAWRALRDTGGPHHNALAPLLATSERHAMNLATGDELSDAMSDAAPIGDAIYNSPGGSASTGANAAAIAASNAVQGRHYIANSWSHIAENGDPEGWGERTRPLHQSVLRYNKEHPASNYVAKPTKLAAIEPPGKTGGSVLVRVPTPTPAPTPAPESKRAPAPTQPKRTSSGPAFILPQ